MKSMRKWSMTFFFSSIVFVVLTMTSLITGSFFVFLARRGVLPGFGGPITPILWMALSSNLVGLLITLMLSHIPLTPLRDMHAGMQKLSQGDFSVRLDLSGPREFRELSDSFNTMAGELDRMTLLRTDFVNNFSHEFKTPLVSLRGYAKLLRKGGLTWQEQQEYLDIIIGEADRLSALATNLLNLSKLEDQRTVIDPRPFDLSEQLRRVIVSLQPRWDEKAITVDVELDDCRYLGDEALMHQVWVNLFDNAIKYTGKGGNILVKLVASPKSVIVTFRDDGCGMGEETRLHIFDKFYQGETSHTSEGNGLGLTLCQRIVQMHGGSIHVSSVQGKGSSFSVELPIQAQP